MRILIILLSLSVCSFCLEQPVASDGGPAGVHFNKGMEYYRDSETEKALNEFKQALEFDGKHKASLEMVKQLEAEVFNPGKSAPYNDIVKEFYEKGLVYFRKGDKEKALKEFEQALKVDPENPQVLEVAARIKKANGEQKEPPVEKKPQKKKKSNEDNSGIKEDKRAVRDPKTVSSPKKDVDEKKISDLYYEGVKAYEQGNLKDAINIWEQVLVLDPGLKKARNILEKAKKQLREGE